MKVLIKPFSQFIPGKGMLTASQVEVSVAHHELGVKARGAYEVQAVVPTKPVGLPETDKVVVVANGAADLTDKQFAAWAADDTYFAHCIVKNAGLTPA